MPLDPLHPAIVNSLKVIDEEHAGFLGMMSGEATPEERDTWPGKVAASKFALAASDQEIIDELTTLGAGGAPALVARHELLLLSEDVGNNPAAIRALAQAILTKSLVSNFASGAAASMRRQGREAIKAAETEAEIDAVIAGMYAAIDAAIAQVEAVMAAMAGG